MRRTLGLALALGALLLGALRAGAQTPQVGRDVLTRLVVCSATAAHLTAANPARTTLTVQNVGTLHVNVGRTPQMFTLHVGAALEFRNYTGGLSCATQPGTGSTAVEVLEEIR